MEPTIQKETGCCPEFNVDIWQDKFFNWNDKKFIKDKVSTFFYMPLNFGKVITKLFRKVESAGASMPDYLCLSYHTSKWNMDIYLAVDQEITGANNLVMNGKFYTRVYDGPFKDTGKWAKDYNINAREMGLTIRKMYMWYTTCPKCAKKYEKNPVVLLGEVD